MGLHKHISGVWKQPKENRETDGKKNDDDTVSIWLGILPYSSKELAINIRFVAVFG